MVGSLVVFCLTYLVIASRQLRWVGLDRPAGAVVGAVAMVVVGGLPMDRALAAIDLHVVVLLFGVLLIAAYLAEARFFRLTAYLVLTRARSARSLLFALTFVVGALSALLLNDTVCVLLTPFRVGTALVPVAVVLAVALNALLPGLAYALARTRGAAAVPVVVFAVVAWSPSVAPGGDVLLPGGSSWQTTISFGVLLLGLLTGIVAALRAR